MPGRARAVALTTALLMTAALPAAASWDEPPRCAGIPATVWGSSASEVLEGTSGPDVIVGLGGNDTIWGRGGDDLICGNLGDDSIVGGPGDDTVLGGPGDDEAFGGGGSDVLLGGDGDDTLGGGAGDDDLRGQGGSDRVLGGDGDDLLRGGHDDDVMLGGAGRDRLIGGPGDDALAGDTDRDRLAGGEGIDILDGGDHRDRLLGGDDDDVLDGGAARDRGNGGKGSDLCGGLDTADRCEVADPGMWDWTRTDQVEVLASRLQSAVVLQTGCDTPFDLDWLGVAAGVFPGDAGVDLAGAVADLDAAASVCNVDEESWRAGLRRALVHLEDLNSRIASGGPEPVGPLATNAEAAAAAADVIVATVGHLLRGDPPRADSDFWWNLQHPAKTRQLRLAGFGAYDVVFIGSSTVAGGVDASLFTELDGRPSYNAALGASGPEIQSRWVDGQVLPIAGPDLVVIGIEGRAFKPMEVVPGSCADSTDDWEAAQSLREGAFAPVEAFAGVAADLRFFGDPATPAPTRPLAAYDYYDANFGPDGSRSVYPPDLTEQQKRDSVEAIKRWSVGFDPCEERIDAAVDLVAGLAGGGTGVVVVVMPTSDIRAGAFDPDGEDDPVAGRAVLDAVFADVGGRVATAGGEFIDLSNHPSITEEMFRDSSHLNAAGNAVFTGLLAAALTPGP